MIQNETDRQITIATQLTIQLFYSKLHKSSCFGTYLETIDKNTKNTVMKTSKFKLNILLLSTAFLFSTTILGQDRGFHVGPRVGIGASDINITNVSGERPGLSTALGVTTMYKFTPFFGISADFLMDYRSMYRNGNGFVVDWDEFGPADYVTRTNMFYASIPLTANVSLGNERFRVGFMTGPSINLFIYGDQNRVYNDSELRQYDERTRLDDINTFNPGFLYGVGFYSTTKEANTFYIDFRHSFGVERIGRINNNNAYIQQAMVSIGLLF